MNDKQDLSKNSWSEWLLQSRKTIALSCAALLVVLIAGVWMMQARKAREIKDFETADILAEELQKSADPTEARNSALVELRELTDRYPILQPRFDSLIAEEMLLHKKPKELDPYAKRTIARLRALGLSDFADFSEVARLSGLHYYKEALKKAQELQNRLSSKKMAKKDTTSHEYLLEAFLLLHIASLHQTLHQNDAMLQTVLQLKEYLGLVERSIPLSQQEKDLASQMVSHLQEEHSSLLDFIIEMPKPNEA